MKGLSLAFITFVVSVAARNIGESDESRGQQSNGKQSEDS